MLNFRSRLGRTLVLGACFAGAALAVVAVAHARPPARPSKLAGVLERLRSDDAQTRHDATRELETLGEEGLSLRDGLKALETAKELAAADKPEDDERVAALVQAAAAAPFPEYIPLVRGLYPKLSDEAKESAMDLLAQLNEPEAPVAILSILAEHAKAGRVPALGLEALRDEPRHAGVLFPALLDYAGVPALEWGVCELTLAYLEAGALRGDALAEKAPPLLAAYAAHRDRLLPAQKHEGVAWMWEEGYQEEREAAALLIDLLGYVDTPETLAELRRALAFDDPKLKNFAVVSLLRRGREVPAKEIEAVAASPEARYWLYSSLAELGKGELYPSKWLTQAAFAESDMVHWLIDSDELGRAPDRIELMKVSPASGAAAGVDGPIDYYLFRFRVDPPQKDAAKGWMAGVAGPFPHEGDPLPDGFGATFSAFTPYEGKPPEEHVRLARERLQRAAAGQEEKALVP